MQPVLSITVMSVGTGFGMVMIVTDAGIKLNEGDRLVCKNDHSHMFHIDTIELIEDLFENYYELDVVIIRSTAGWVHLSEMIKPGDKLLILKTVTEGHEK
jgi:hypothetical protein